ncbi:MrpF/PhaF family protein [Microbacterium sp. Marseille-Q6965]|uniref:MrpF/PhaF family protein n=1 Tax=Microbacterium sp. Marseille-Q6965 TaxID=2965072 RepID=UPI0021B7544B|nr:MrpF/PhaF family protein [Microbacterium sp. Marseille-Q6965]
MTGVLVAVIAAIFAVAAAVALVRLVRGPSILDRAVASDVLLTEVMCLIGAEMVINRHADTLPLMLIIAAVGVFGTVAVARFVARRDQ